MLKFIIKFKHMFLKERCISITDLRINTKACLERLKDGEKYVFVNNKPKAVIVDIEVFEKLVLPQFHEFPAEEVTPELKAKIQKSKKNLKEGLLNI